MSQSYTLGARLDGNNISLIVISRVSKIYVDSYTHIFIYIYIYIVGIC